MTFKELGLNEDLLEALGHMNFTEATPIQEEAIPLILAGHDLIACAQTGTGKTAAFLLPVLQIISQHRTTATRALIICPTRELAIQIDRQIQGLAYFLGVFSIPVYGGGSGEDWDQQKKALIEGVDIVVATPGKLISHLTMGYVKFDQITHLILDEADRMMDMGFRDDILKIVEYLPTKRQNLMFSATMPQKIRSLIKKILHEPKQINLALSKPAEGVVQASYLVHDEQKARLVKSLIDDKPSINKIIIFCSTKDKVKEAYRVLQSKKYGVAAISSDLEQEEREDVLRKFVSGAYRVLVATDVISRGIDIKDIDLVINYDVPRNAEDYVHRVGRTARASTQGVAITLISEQGMRDFADIETLIENEIIKLKIPEELGIGPEWNPRSRGTRGGGGGRQNFSKNKSKSSKGGSKRRNGPRNKGNQGQAPKKES